MMSHLKSFRMAVMAGIVLLAAGRGGVAAQQKPGSLCSPLIQEEMLQLEEFELEVELARAEFAARVRIFEMIDKLWENKVIERMIFLQSRYERDSTRLQFEAADRVAERQEALIERYRAACGKGNPETAPSTGRYLRAHCDSLSKRVEAAKIDLEFDRQFLDNIHDLREGNVATAQDVILAELAVEKDEIRIADATRRLQICRGDPGGKVGTDPE